MIDEFDLDQDGEISEAEFVRNQVKHLPIPDSTNVDLLQ